MTVPEPSTRADRASQTRQRILAIAGQLFSAYSYESTSLQQIADEMGLTKAAVYHHFRTKAEIFSAIVVPGLESMNSLLDFAETKRSGTERTRLVLTGLVDTLVAQRDAIRLLQANPLIAIKPESETASFDGVRERAVRVLFGESPTPDQRAALYITIALASAVHALADLPAAVLHGTLTRACTRLFDTA